MRKAMLFLAMLGLVNSLWAAHPFVGTWKLNVAKSKTGPAGLTAAKEMTVVCQETAADLESVLTGTGTDGKPISYKWTIAKQGGLLGVAQGGAQALAEATFVVITVIDPSDMYGTTIQKGKQVEVTHTFISKDGKTMMRTSKSTDAQGNLVETLMVFEKQQ